MDQRANPIRRQRCAIYTRKSSEEGLEQEFNSLHAQREACEAYICQSALNRDPLSAPKIDPLELSWPGAA
jgi:hypothetical protein